ncbi:hypothetical protein BZG02_20570 [Labilibaculum filiforme]|uniref:Uncharacterized protein n=1 Tax=Labilibaculum filiforme TaxID=1940526 RepID=A0A2N3HQ25_9BACT|nr:hypothetical protein [Labilibaculum filiforme]PKQ60152.1 hypothetical protein BZG02_20570 [Labilibaculum filiforme]
MEYIIDLRFEDKNYCAIIHFVTTYTVNSEEESKLFLSELLTGFQRREVIILHYSNNRIDNDEILKRRSYEYLEFTKSQATASIQIEQFHLSKPDQNKTLIENLTDKFWNGEDSIANIGKKFNIPVKVYNKESRNPISGEFYYFSIEHLIPKE